jgi:NAD(P)-dependent dehydrogenase (short-subunit alcohol dehydrogenase family)
VACVTRRHRDKLEGLVATIEGEGGRARAFGSDARKEDAVIQLVADIEREVGPIEVAVFNIGANVRFPVTETTARVYFKVWEMACFAGFLLGREVAKVMLPRGRGTILFTGATASLRGGHGYCAFAGAKAGLRALAQSMARELSPNGIHVAHVVIDGAIDTEFIRVNFPKRAALKDKDGILNPEAIAEAYFALAQQTRSAWTHEMDLRPWMETW